MVGVSHCRTSTFESLGTTKADGSEQQLAKTPQDDSLTPSQQS